MTTEASCQAVPDATATTAPPPAAARVDRSEELARLALVARFTDNAVAITDAQHRIEWVNEGFTRVTGWKFDEVVGRRPYDFMHGPDSDPDTVDYLRSRLTLEQGFDVELLKYRKDGRAYWAAVEVRPIRDDAGIVRCYVSIESDITKQHAQAQRIREESAHVQQLAEALRGEKCLLEGVISTIPHAVCWTDPALAVIGCNETFRVLLSDVGDPLGKPLDHILAAQFGDDAPLYRTRVLESGESLLNREHAWQRPDGSKNVMVSSAVPLPGAGRRGVSGMLWAATDITALRGLEHELDQARRLEAIGQLAAGVAHEINTPSQYVSDNIAFLNDAFGALLPVLDAVRALLARDASAAEVERLRAAVAAADLDYLVDEMPAAIAQSRDGVGHIKKIVLAMKEFSHPGREGKEPVDLNKLVRNVMTVARNEWKYVAETVLDLDEELPPVPAVASGINQVLLNLVVNAAHALAGDSGEQREGKGTITIRTRRDGEHAVLEVADDGCGIPAANLSRIFDPFFTTKEVGRGTGQGLAIAHRVVHDVHGGTITVASTVGVGTRFTVRLPLASGVDTGMQAGP